jgi:hypothetical protein
MNPIQRNGKAERQLDRAGSGVRITNSERVRRAAKAPDLCVQPRAPLWLPFRQAGSPLRARPISVFPPSRGPGAKRQRLAAYRSLDHCRHRSFFASKREGGHPCASKTKVRGGSSSRSDADAIGPLNLSRQATQRIYIQSTVWIGVISTQDSTTKSQKKTHKIVPLRPQHVQGDS